jgi:hypothetical protein
VEVSAFAVVGCVQWILGYIVIVWGLCLFRLRGCSFTGSPILGTMSLDLGGVGRFRACVVCYSNTSGSCMMCLVNMDRLRESPAFGRVVFLGCGFGGVGLKLALARTFELIF